MGADCITFSGIGLKRGQYAFPMSESRFCMHFRLLIIVLGHSAAYFFEMIMPFR